MPTKGLVRAGYEAIAREYLRDREASPQGDDVRMLDDLVSDLPRGGRVLDAGSGSGVPVARILSRSFRVVGLDLADAQVRLARSRVPVAEFAVGDMTHLPFRDEAFEGVCSFYAIIHVPREEHGGVAREIHRVLKPSGAALLCMGEKDLPGQVEEYMGTRMFWSHFDGRTNERLLLDSGFQVLGSKAVTDSQDPSSAHRFFLVRKR